MNIIYLIGSIQSLFVSSLLLFKKKKQPSDFILVAYILVLGAFLFFTYAYSEGIISRNPFLIILDILYWVLIGPLLSIYIGLISGGIKKFRFKHIIIFIPAAIILLGFSSFFFQTETNDFFQYDPDTPLFTFAWYLWIYNSPIFYIYCLFQLYQHRRRIKHYFSFSKNVDLSWLFYLVHGYAIFLFFGLISGFLRNLFNIVIPFSSYDYSWFVMSLYIFGMGYYGFQQKGLFSEGVAPEDLKSRRPGKNDDRLITPKSNVSEKEAIIIQSRLIDEMEISKAYHDCELDLRKLSLKLETTPHKLSQVINERLNCNFYELINKYRVEEMKDALLDPKKKHLKIVSLAYDCGFNSKSSFYNTFRKSTKLSPLEYKAVHKN